MTRPVSPPSPRQAPGAFPAGPLPGREKAADPFPLDEPEVEVARIERAIAEHDWHCAEHRGWKIHFEYPPIPDRRFDYQASDPNGDGEPVAYGRTIEECKADIDRILEEREDELTAARLKVDDLMLARLHGDAEQAEAIARLRLQSAEWAQREIDDGIDFLILGSIAGGLIVVLLLVAPMVDAWLGRVL